MENIKEYLFSRANSSFRCSSANQIAKLFTVMCCFSCQERNLHLPKLSSAKKNTKIVDGLSEGKIDIGLCFFKYIIINNTPRLFFNAVLSVEKNEGKDFLNKVSSKVSDNRVVCALYFKTLSMSLNSNLN